MLFLFHLSVVVLNIFTLWYDQRYVKLPFPNEEIAAMPFKARILFLTVWCFVLQTVYFTVALLNDIFGTNTIALKKPPLIRKIKDFLFSLAFTIAVYVASAFWGLYYINKEFIFPNEVEKQVPFWVNHSMHTLIVLFILIELLISKRNYPTRTLGITAALLFNFVYVFFIHAMYFYTGMWVYPFLNVFTWPMKILYFTCSTTTGISFYVLGEKLNRLSTLDIKVIYKNAVDKLQ